MKQRDLPLIVALLATVGCRTVTGRDVRYEPTPTPVVRAMLEVAAVGPQDVVYVLGSNDGRILITAAREFGARGVGLRSTLCWSSGRGSTPAKLRSDLRPRSRVVS